MQAVLERKAPLFALRVAVSTEVLSPLLDQELGDEDVARETTDTVGGLPGSSARASRYVRGW